MVPKDERTLNTIREQYISDMTKGARKMLEFWLNRQPHASWNQLIAALKANHIGLNFLAVEIEEMLWPEGMKMSS